MTEPEDTCQLYLIVPPGIGPDELARFARAGGFADVACALLRAGPDGLIDRGRALVVLDAAHAAGVPLVFENDAHAAADLSADGVHIRAGEADYAGARRRLGDDAIVGADCGLSRHAALTLAELGADYVAFSHAADAPSGDTLEDMIAWWADVTVVPCVAWDAPDMETALKLAGAGADFVAADAPVWSQPESAAAAADLAARLAEHRIAA